jgi:geranylgeranyl pyrophosphate synthase
VVASSGGKQAAPAVHDRCRRQGGVFDDPVVDAATAIEPVQVGSLVHDDTIDDAATRRGRPTINAVEGVSHAMMAGDYILARAAALAAGVSRDAAAPSPPPSPTCARATCSRCATPSTLRARSRRTSRP